MTVLFASLSARIAMVFGLALAVISVAMLSEYWGGLIPCALCLKQRVAFFVAVPLLALAFIYARHTPCMHLCASYSSLTSTYFAVVACQFGFPSQVV